MLQAERIGFMASFLHLRDSRRFQFHKVRSTHRSRNYCNRIACINCPASNVEQCCCPPRPQIKQLFEAGKHDMICEHVKAALRTLGVAAGPQ